MKRSKPITFPALAKEIQQRVKYSEITVLLKLGREWGCLSAILKELKETSWSARSICISTTLGLS